MLNAQTTTPRVYIACLAAYNEGHLHGKWIDVDTADNVNEKIQHILKTSPAFSAEEWAIHDFEGFGSIQISEYTGVETLVEYAMFISEHGELGAEVLAHFSNDFDDAKTCLEDNYHGAYKSEEDFVIELTEQTIEIPKHLEYYIDYEKMARNYFINDFFSIEANGMTHVFSHI